MPPPIPTFHETQQYLPTEALETTQFEPVYVQSPIELPSRRFLRPTSTREPILDLKMSQLSATTLPAPTVDPSTVTPRYRVAVASTRDPSTRASLAAIARLREVGLLLGTDEAIERLVHRTRLPPLPGKR